MIRISKENYKKYGECVSFEANDIKLLVTVELGPRIIFYGKNNQNILFEDLQDTTNKGGEFFDTNLKGKGIWHLYGGHRLWKSPEYMDTYYPDNSRVEVIEQKDGSVCFISDVEITTGLQKSIIIKMADDGSVEVTQIMKNASKETIKDISAWGLTVLANGAKATFNLSKEDTGFLPNRNVVFWSYADVNDERLTISNDKVIVEQKDIVAPIKIGLYTENEVKAEVKGQLFSVRTDKKVGTYPDFYCNYECYTNNYILEVETLSPLQNIAPGEELEHIEYWALK